ncbi:MAG: transcription factor, partial [Maioricimonas sp. JB049]
FPVTNPHWVQNGPDVSVSFSITFRTPDLDRRAGVHRVNACLRRLGLTPGPAGKHPKRDWCKYQAHRLYRRLRPTE